ncbi:MAG: DUF4156 domain-containing protein, partial [Polyangiales bacterium]
LHPGCKASQLTSHGTEVAILASEPVGCERLGDIIGHGGGIGGGYTQKSVLSESAVNRARNAAAELGATHVVLQEPDFEHGSATAVTRNQQPALAHGDGSSTRASVEGVAYKCRPGTVPTVVASVLPVVDNPPASISLAPLGPLDRVVVYQKTPATPGVPASDTEAFRLEDAAKVEAVSASLADLALDPIKYIPTHRVEFVGELGTQSLLYGFGYLQYAGNTYRLTTGTFERELQLVEPPGGSEAAETTPAEGSSGGEAP